MTDLEETRVGRRGFLTWLGRGFLALWVPAVGAMMASFLKAPSSESRPGERQLKAGKLSTLGVGVTHHARLAETQVMAISAICTHQRCGLKWKRDDSTFQCPGHDGAFDRTGNVLSGPPKKSLRQYPAEIRADEIIVHT